MLRRRPPLSPEAAELLRALGPIPGPSRRSLLTGAGALGLGAVLAACGTKGAGATPGGGATSGGASATGPAAAADRSDTEKVVNWANWTLYLDYDDKTKKYPTLEAFQKKTGLKATYAEDIDDNDTYYGKIQAQLKQARTSARTSSSSPTGWPAAWSARATCRSSTTPRSRTRRTSCPRSPTSSFDPGRQYTMTWQCGYGGARLQQAEGGTPV